MKKLFNEVKIKSVTISVDKLHIPTQIYYIHTGSLKNILCNISYICPNVFTTKKFSAEPQLSKQ